MKRLLIALSFLPVVVFAQADPDIELAAKFNRPLLEIKLQKLQQHISEIRDMKRLEDEGRSGVIKLSPEQKAELRQSRRTKIQGLQAFCDSVKGLGVGEQ